MILDDIEAPEAERMESRSSLDFAYWMLTYVAYSMPKDYIVTAHTGGESQDNAMMQAVMFSGAQIALPYLPPDPAKFRKYCERKTVTLEKALRGRGAMMFSGKNMVMSLGDNKRVMEYLDDDFVVRYLRKDELLETAWVCTLIPDMIYL